VYKNPLLAKTYRLVAEKGKAGFYGGFVAEAIAKAVSDQAGFLDEEDLREHGMIGSEVVEPVAMRLHEHLVSGLYQGEKGGEIDLWEHPPNGQGVVAQIALGILQVLEEEGKVEKFTVEEHNSVR
jgi:gamma-glutamyltranspeptidase / glutathione hydrolase